MIAPVTLPSGRTVLDTGKRNGKMPLYIGILGRPMPQRDPGSQAEIVQRLLTTPEPPRDWHTCPREFYVSPSLWRRLLRLIHL